MPNKYTLDTRPERREFIRETPSFPTVEINTFDPPTEQGGNAGVLVFVVTFLIMAVTIGLFLLSH